ncbi:MarR family transcriptional regulator [Candidatus Sumerlaeota bacterium]|nr:MarR family transcriptional regulator [Candidatus Sumerlaeota bacterium]
MSKLQQELRQTKAFVSKRQEALLALQRTTDLVSRPVEKIFSRWKLTPEQYNVLRILRGAEPDGLPTLEIGRRMITRASNVTRIIDRLEIKRYVTRHRESGDRRVVRIRITSQGLQLLSKMQSAVDSNTEQAMGGVSETEAARLVLLLERVRDGLDGQKN